MSVVLTILAYVAYWCAVSFGLLLLWCALLWLTRRPAKSQHPKGSPLVCIRGETPADAIRVLLEEAA